MSTLVTGEAIHLDVRPASLLARCLSGGIDYVTYFVVYVAVFVGFSWLLNNLFAINTLLEESVSLILVVLTIVLIPASIETLSRGRSLGRLIVGLRIVRDDGGAITFRHAFIRSMMWQFEVLSTGASVATLTALLNGRTKRLGDLLAGTIAVRERSSRLYLAPVHMPPHLARWAHTVDISPIPAGLFYRITQFLANSTKTMPQARLARAIELAEELNPFVAPAAPEGTHPEDFLAAVVVSVRHENFQRLTKEQATITTFEQQASRLPYGLSRTPTRE